MDIKNQSFQHTLILVLVAILAVVSITAVTIISQNTASRQTSQALYSEAKGRTESGGVTLTGNGFPPGHHFILSIKAKKQPPVGSARWTDDEMLQEEKSGGNTIFMIENQPCTIELVNNDRLVPTLDPAFGVEDKNCMDGKAKYRLPAPTTLEDPYNTLYSVYMRPLGTPGRKIDMQTCGMMDTNEDGVGDEELCSLERLSAVRMKGRSTAINVSDKLLSVVATYDFDGDGVVETVRIPLFSEDPLYTNVLEYVWQANGDIRNLQLRFYPGVVTTFTPVQ